MDNEQRFAERSREHVYEILDIALAWARRGRDRSVTVVAIELDDLEALRADGPVPELAAILDVLGARLADLQSVTYLRSGETLVLVSTAPRSHFDAISLADRAARTIARPVATSGSEVTVTAGIGVRLSRNGIGDAHRLLEDAVHALDEAQRRGPGQVAMFSSEHRRRTLGSRHLPMQFEPVVSLRDGRVSNYEATVPHDYRGADTRALEVFLDNLGFAMTLWPVDVDVSFNVSPSQLFDRALSAARPRSGGSVLTRPRPIRVRDRRMPSPG